MISRACFDMEVRCLRRRRCEIAVGMDTQILNAIFVGLKRVKYVLII